MDKWILTSERMPEPDGYKPVIAYHGKYTFPLRYVGRIIRGKYIERWEDMNWSIYYGEVTGWMPFPESPEKD